MCIPLEDSYLILSYLTLPCNLGRAGEKGTAYTLVTDKDKEFAGHLVRNLEGANQEVPQTLLDLALQVRLIIHLFYFNLLKMK